MSSAMSPRDAAGMKEEMPSFAAELARNAKITEGHRLPPNQDLTAAQEKEVQAQARINAIIGLPSPAADKMKQCFKDAFTAAHLPALASALHSLSPDTQPEALSTYIQIFSLFGEAQHQPYLRKFLRDSPSAQGLPNLVSRAFVKGIKWKRPSGPGHICCLIIDLILWCDPSMGSDGQASVDLDLRAALSKKIEQLKELPTYNQLDRIQRVELERLHGMLGLLETIVTDGGPKAYYVTSSREHLESSRGMFDCQGPDCDADEAGLICSRCKTAQYCSSRCQGLHWKEGHKIRCFESVL